MRRLEEKDYVGNVYNYLTIICFIGIKNGHTQVRCKCSCGKTHDCLLAHLKNGNTKSCGHYGLSVGFTNKTHGESYARNGLYNTWHHMKARCFNPKNEHFKEYGERGITVCDEWVKDFLLFKNWALENGYKLRLEIDRINNNGSYTPDNCRFVNRKENNNNKRNSLYFKVFDIIKRPMEWAEIVEVPANYIYRRINKDKWTIEKAILTPVGKNFSCPKQLTYDQLLGKLSEWQERQK